MPPIVLHIAERGTWEAALPTGVYRAGSLATEGFLHCSDPHQVLSVADALFPGRTDLVVLVLDASMLRSELLYEPGTDNPAELFPHLYGPIDAGAVIEVFDLVPGSDGRLRFPFGVLPERWFANEAEWTVATRRLLECSYAAGGDPFGGSGFHGGPERWRRAREPIVEAIDRDGTLLDVGCANGLLMESVARWAAERGRRVEPFGLDISERLAALAHARMPHWADRIFVGDAATWRPPRRFDFVPTELDYVPERHRRDLVRRLLDQTVTAGGRVIVCSYGSVGLSRPADPVEQMLRDWGFDLAGQAGADEGGLPITRVAWVCRR